MTDTERLYSQTPIARLFLMVSIPGAIGMLLQSAYDLADGVLVGQFVNETAFAAINLAMPFVVINFALGDLIGVGSAVPISHALGRGDRERADNIFTCACIMNVAFGLVVGLTFLMVAPQLMALVGATGELQEQATLYLRVYAASLPITSVTYAFDNYLRICGRIHRSLFCNALLAAGGSALEFLLLGTFDMGVGAAAVSYCIAMGCSVCVSLWPFARGKLDLSFCRPRFSVALVAEIVRDGAPAFLVNTASRISSIVLNAVLLSLGGEDAVSIFGVTMFCDEFVVPLVYGVVDSVQPAVCFCWGAKNHSRVRSLERCCFVAAGTISLLFAVVVFVFPEAITYLFLPEADEALLMQSIHALHLVALAILFRWLPLAIQSYMVVVEQPRLAAVCGVAQSLVFPLLALVALRPLGIEGLWLNMSVSTICSCMVSLGIFFHYRSKAHGRTERAHERARILGASVS